MHLTGGIAAGMVASGGIAYGHGRFFTHCTKASVSDDQGLIEMLSSNIAYFKSKPVNIPKVTILLDNGYHKDLIQTALEQVYPGIMKKIRLEHSAKPSKAEKAACGKSGFVPVRMRWVIERTNAWVERCKRPCPQRSRPLGASWDQDRCILWSRRVW